MTTVEQRPSRTVLVDIRQAVPTLRPAERRIAENLLADPAAFASMAIAQVARAADTSTTTVVRFYRRIGFARFRDLQLDLTRETLRERLEVAAPDADARDIEPGDDLEQVIAKIALSETLSISDTAQVLDTAQLARAVALVGGASRVDVFGVGAGAIVALDLQRKLSRLGRACLSWPDSDGAWTAASVLPPGAVAVAVSHSGATIDTVEFLHLAREAGAATVAITNHPDSPLARGADVVLLTAARETSFRSGALGSRIAQLMVVDCLFIGVAQAAYDASVAALDRTYRAVRERRVGP
jgi:DNA-binding MurR/RpiR family transcriptional regulator